MRVSIKKFLVPLQLGSKGIELDVSGNKGHVGDLCIGKAGVEWCSGKTHQGHGIKKSWDKLIRFFEENPS